MKEEVVDRESQSLANIFEETIDRLIIGELGDGYTDEEFELKSSEIRDDIIECLLKRVGDKLYWGDKCDEL